MPALPGHVSVEQALAWIDTATRCLESEDILLREAAGRVAAEDIRAVRPVPLVDRAALDGFAVRAIETMGAGSYNPLVLPAHIVAAGDNLPEGADAVVPLEQVEAEGDGRATLVAAIAVGDNVERRGAVTETGELLVRVGTRLGPRHLGLLASAGLTHLAVVRRPRVRVAVAGSVPAGSVEDSDGPMVEAAVERDGGIVIAASLGDAFAAGADIVLVIGGTGPGPADKSAAALAAAGELAIHGVALRPGETAGFGRTRSGTPVILLPGAPAGCLWAYELFAGRAIRHLGSRDPELPYRRRQMTTARKIVSAIGTTEICEVRCRPDRLIEPLAPFAEIGLMAAVGADGFVIIPDTREGYPAGAAVDAYLYEASMEALR